MKAVLYAVVTHETWIWRVSVALEVDLEYWFGLDGGAGSLVALEPRLSLGQAYVLQELLQGERRRLRTETEWLRRIRKAALEARLPETVIAELWLCRVQAGLEAVDKPGAKAEAGARRERGREQEERGSPPGVGLRLEVLEQLEALLQGRLLTRDELAGLLEHAGLPLPRGEEARYLQAAALRGAAELLTGLERVPRARWGWPALGARRGVQLRCRRCGSGGAHLHATACPHCGGPCAYCEACLALGRQRQCSLLVRGRAPLRRQPQAGLSAQPRGDSLATPQMAGQPHALANTRRGLASPDPAPAPSKDMLAPLQRSSVPHSPAPATQHGLSPSPTPPTDPLAHWGLSPAQRTAVEAALAYLTSPPSPLRPGFGKPAALPPRRFLIWAVTGAGKTEMIFPLIEAELARGGTVLIATPRRDVVLELRPRVERAFPERTLVTLYGGSEDRWKRGDITLSTTHQLMRFGPAFDLVIIDELDAFPYHNNPQLQHAAVQVLRPGGAFVYLSATPPPAMQREVARKRLASVRVPVRFHRFPLPVPRLLRMSRKHPLPLSLQQALAASLERAAQLFVFVPAIRDVEPTVQRLQTRFPHVPIAGTSSQDAERSDKVADFRAARLRILVTTTILERGVTIPKSDVFILQADAALFDEASLVQMAGRAGRSKDDPQGRVYFASSAKTDAQAGAIRQIKRMNRLAHRNGFLLSLQPGGDSSV